MRFDPMRAEGIRALRFEPRRLFAGDPDQPRDDDGKWSGDGGGDGGSDGGKDDDFEALPVEDVPSPKMPPEGRKGYSEHQADQFAKLEPHEMHAIEGFTNGYDWAIREIDKGKGDEEILRDIDDHRSKTPDKEFLETPQEHLDKAKEMHADLYSAIDKMDPVSERVVYRGLKDLDRKTFDAIRTAEHVNIGAVSSTSWNPQVATNFADLDLPTEGKHQVIFSLTTRSGRAIEDASAFQGEREILLPKGVRFKVTRVVRPDGPAVNSAVIIHAEEIDGIIDRDHDGRVGKDEEQDDEKT